jgi:hypothetical protein
VWEEAYHKCYNSEQLTPEFKEDYERTFMEALLMYRHPIVFDPLLQKCIFIHQKVGLGGKLVLSGDAELLQHQPYAKLCRNFQRITSVVGELPAEEEAVGIAEGRIDWRGRVFTSSEEPARKRKRDEEDIGKSSLPERPRNLLSGLDRVSWEMDDGDLENKVMAVDFDESEGEDDAIKDKQVDDDGDLYSEEHQLEEEEIRQDKNYKSDEGDDFSESDATSDSISVNDHGDNSEDIDTATIAGVDSTRTPFAKLARKLFPFPSSTKKQSPPPVDSQETVLYEVEKTVVETFIVDAQEETVDSNSNSSPHMEPMTQEEKTEEKSIGTSSQKRRRGKRERISPKHDESVVNETTTTLAKEAETDEDSDASAPMSLEKATS